MITKICNKCKVEKLVKDFYNRNNKPISICKICSRKNMIKYNNSVKGIKVHDKWCKKYMKLNQRKYHASTKGIYNILKRTAKERKLKLLSRDDFIKWYNATEKICQYCKRTLEEIQHDKIENSNNIRRLSIDRKDNNKGYVLSNLGLACYRCNHVKGNYFSESQMLKIGNILKEIY